MEEAGSGKGDAKEKAKAAAAKAKVKLTPPILKVINIITCLLIIFTNLLRYFVRKDNKEGIDGCPIALFFVQTVLTIMHAVFIICGELWCPPILIANYPLLVSRVGRGALIVLVGVPLTGPNFFVVVLVFLIALVGLINIWIGWDDPVVTMKLAKDGPTEGTTSKENDAVQMPPQTSANPALTGTGPSEPPPPMPDYKP